MRGGYILRNTPAAMNGRAFNISCFGQPTSEGIVDKRFGLVAIQLLQDAEKRQPHLFGVGLGGWDEPVTRMPELRHARAGADAAGRGTGLGRWRDPRPRHALARRRLRPPGCGVTAPLLVFGWGNRSRGDDALGPLFVEQLGAAMADAVAGGEIELLDDYQLQPEHALDLVGRQRVLFVDASLKAAAPFELSTVHADPTPAAVSTHALSPQALLQVYLRVHGAEPPPCTLLAIRGESFELGAPPGEAALQNLRSALDWARGWCR